MKSFRILPSILTLLLLSFALTSFAADPQPLEIGDPFPAIAGEDQHGVPYSVDGARYILVSFDMKSGKRANAWFEGHGANYLPEHNAVFVANIHGMPSIGRFFALPKMRKYPHRILLADEEGLLDDLPREDGKISVFTLNQEGRIENIGFWKPDFEEPLPPIKE